MKYGFVKLKGQPDTSVNVYMEVREYERYKDKEIFRDNAISLCVFDLIYIAVFPLIVRLDEILEYNKEAVLVDEIPLSDICFQSSSVNQIADVLGCNNTLTFNYLFEPNVRA